MTDPDFILAVKGVAGFIIGSLLATLTREAYFAWHERKERRRRRARKA